MRFKKGDKVEVMNIKEAAISWHTAEILSGNGITYRVQYDFYCGLPSEQLPLPKTLNQSFLNPEYYCEICSNSSLMAEHLASIFGTEKDRVNCPFYFKIGACRHGDRCSRLHTKPSVSPTLLLSNMYQRPDMIAPGVDSEGQPIDPEKMQEHFEVARFGCLFLEESLSDNSTVLTFHLFLFSLFVINDMFVMHCAPIGMVDMISD